MYMDPIHEGSAEQWEAQAGKMGLDKPLGSST